MRQVPCRFLHAVDTGMNTIPAGSLGDPSPGAASPEMRKAPPENRRARPCRTGEPERIDRRSPVAIPIVLLMAMLGSISCRYIGPFSGRKESGDAVVPQEKIDQGLRNAAQFNDFQNEERFDRTEREKFDKK